MKNKQTNGITYYNVINLPSEILYKDFCFR